MTEPRGSARREAEGVIKFELMFEDAPAPKHPRLMELEGWRRLLHCLGLIGQSENRYHGLAYGNVSLRVDADRFLVSGTQTGGAAQLTENGYCWVDAFDLAANRIHARGGIRPSSEALSHAALYAANFSIESVIHVHSPILWRAAMEGFLDIPTTAPDLPYGTPELGQALQALARDRMGPVICMAGHEDGLLGYGSSPKRAACALLSVLAGALPNDPAASDFQSDHVRALLQQ